jgi:uncharacterized protein YifN (PemK superfamily)
MAKTRRVVVVSVTSRNHRHGTGPGLALVVPLSMTAPLSIEPCDVLMPGGVYRSLSQAVWAKCGAVTLVSHDRLDRVRIYKGGKPAYIVERLSAADMARIETGLRYALGLS